MVRREYRFDGAAEAEDFNLYGKPASIGVVVDGSVGLIVDDAIVPIHSISSDMESSGR